MLGVAFFAGVTTMQIVFLIFNYILLKRKEFLYYLIFVLFVSLFIFLALFPEKSPFVGNPTIRTNLHYRFLIIAQGVYFRFLRHAVEAPRRYLFFNRVLKISENTIFIIALILILQLFLFGQHEKMMYFGILVYAGITILQVYLIIFLLRTKDRFNHLILLGSIIMGVLMKIGIIPSLLMSSDPEQMLPLSNSIFLGITINFLFFNFVLIYKARRMEMEYNKQELEKQKVLSNQRLEISHDLHDDLGASLSSLHVYSSVVEKSMETDRILASLYLSKISEGIQSVMGKMNDVIWAINYDPSNEKLFSSHIKDFYVDVFDAKNMECHYDIDQDLEKKITGIKARKNLLLIAKESINNSVKHSEATTIRISLQQFEDKLRIRVQDDGKGLSESNHNNGKGMPGLHLRAEQLGGKLSIRNVPEKGGVLMECFIPLTNISDALK